MKDLILLLIGSVVMNNCLLQGYLGVTFAMGNAKCPCKCIKLGLSVTAVMVLTTLITWPVQNFVLAPFGLEYLRTLLFVLVILALVYAMKAYVKLDGVCFPLIALNGAVDRFIGRFEAIEREIAGKGLRFEDLAEETLRKYWMS